MDQSLKAQAMSAGVQAAKGLFSKKVKQIKVTIKAGYKILLMDANWELSELKHGFTNKVIWISEMTLLDCSSYAETR